MNSKWHQDVLDFHEKFGIPIGDEPKMPDDMLVSLRRNLIIEEYGEMMTEGFHENSIVDIADGAVDLIYVLVGMLATFGIDASAVWDEVHRTNMAKAGGKKRLDGKILKPKGWEPPEIFRAMHGWRHGG